MVEKRADEVQKGDIVKTMYGGFEMVTYAWTIPAEDVAYLMFEGHSERFKPHAKVTVRVLTV